MRVQVSGKDFIAFVDAEDFEDAYFKIMRGMDAEDVEFREVKKNG